MRPRGITWYFKVYNNVNGHYNRIMEMTPEQRLRARFKLADHELETKWKTGGYLNPSQLTDEEAHGYFVDDIFAEMTDGELHEELQNRGLTL
jgi:hypothetical protein